MIYIILYFFIFIVSIFNIRKTIKNDFGFKFLCVLLVLFIGFRYEVGADWHNYLYHLEFFSNTELIFNFYIKEILYYLTVWFASNIFGGIYFVNSFFAVIFCYGLYRFAETFSSNRYSLLMIAFPVLIVVICLGFSRQSVAIGLFMLGLVQLIKGNNAKYILLILTATLFHLSAIVLLPLVFLFVKQKKYISYPIVIIVVYAAVNALLLPNLEYYDNSYIQRGYNSSGALIRVLMNTISGLIFLMSKRHLVTNINSYKLWKLISYATLLCFLLYLLSPSSTAVDRLSYYLIPIQLFVFSNLIRLPFKSNSLKIGNSFVFLFGLIVLCSWILLADHSKYWLPYNSYFFNI